MTAHEAVVVEGLGLVVRVRSDADTQALSALSDDRNQGRVEHVRLRGVRPSASPGFGDQADAARARERIRQDTEKHRKHWRRCVIAAYGLMTYHAKRGHEVEAEAWTDYILSAPSLAGIAALQRKLRGPTALPASGPQAMTPVQLASLPASTRKALGIKNTDPERLKRLLSKAGSITPTSWT